MLRIELLQQAVIDKYKANCLLDQMVSDIKDVVKNRAWQKYALSKIRRDGMDFKLINTKAWFYPSFPELGKIQLSLFFIVEDEMQVPKNKRETLNRAKEALQQSQFYRNNYKVELWFDLSFDIELDRAISGDYNLSLK